MFLCNGKNLEGLINAYQKHLRKETVLGTVCDKKRIEVYYIFFDNADTGTRKIDFNKVL